MAGQTYELTLDVGDQLWELVGDLAEAVPPQSWVLVGGLMVQAHALRAGVSVTRQTIDIDAVLNLSIASISEIARPIIQMGFATYRPEFGGPFHRFKKDSHTIDVMVGRDVRQSVKWAGKEILRSPGAAQAIMRADKYILCFGDARKIPIYVPDSVGAVIAKSAAHKVDRRDRDRHLTDLLSLPASAPSGSFISAKFSPKDISYLRHVHHELKNVEQKYWLILSPQDYSRAINAFDELQQVL